MSRGDRREDIFLNDEDRLDFLKTARLQKETTLPLKNVAARLQFGTAKSAKARLREWLATKPNPGSVQSRLGK